MTECQPGFDHSALAGLPSYQKARRALSDLANELDRLDDRPLWADWERYAAEMARSSHLADCCEDCYPADNSMRWPFSVKPGEDGYLTCGYQCDHGHRWQCWWSAAQFWDHAAPHE